VEEQRHQLLTLALDGDEWSTTRPSHRTTGAVISGMHGKGGWAGLGAGLGYLEKGKSLLPFNPSVITIPTELSLIQLRYGQE
jgi:hypothetical protein